MKVFFKEHKKSNGFFLGEIKLTRSEALHSIDLKMVLSLRNQLERWEKDPRIEMIFLHAEGEKAFCVGGDVKQIYFHVLQARKNQQNPKEVVQPFVENEYRLNYLLHTYSKPILVWGEGLIMGGGFGLFWAGSHRIGTESTNLSMPEIRIGLFPDVGTSFFLSHLPNQLGWYIALTAYQLNSSEAKTIGLLDFCFENSEKQKLFQSLLDFSFKYKNELTSHLREMEKESQFLKREDWLEDNQLKITSFVQSKNLPTIFEQFQKSQWEEKKHKENQKVFLQSSPLSAGLICEQLKRAENKNLKEVLQMDLVMALHCVYKSDFLEGVRALLVEKDNSPKWNPSSFDQIKDSAIQEYFTPDFGWTNPLKGL